MSATGPDTNAAFAALEHVAADEADLFERLVDVMIERDTFRALAQESIHTLHHLQAENGRLHDQLNRLRAEYRALREHLMSRGVAA
jgi:hypothetical protein